MSDLCICDKITFLKKQPDDIKVIILYRNLSFVITSLFYLIGNSGHAILRKLFIITCILCSSVLLQYLYVKVYHLTEKIVLLLSIEIIGYIILLIPSGGINSPYIWYSLNTILLISIRLNSRYCWINLLIYFFSFYIASFVQDTWNNGFDKNMIDVDMNLILSLLLITLAMQILGKNIKKMKKDKRDLEESNCLLTNSNYEIKKSINYILELYQAIEIFTASKDRMGLFELIVTYTKKIIENPTIAFYNIQNSKTILLTNKRDLRKEYEEAINEKIMENKNKIINSKEVCELEIADLILICTPIKSRYTSYGILGIKKKSENTKTDLYRKQLNFISSLATIVLERMELEDINQGLLINEEQNRIANEIHDHVLQRLFSASCSLFTMMKKGNSISSEMKVELDLTRNAINYAMKDLRLIIYGMSWEKDGVNDFDKKLKNYIDETRSLTGIQIKLDIQGNYELLNLKQKKAVYRIISESVGNGVKHSKAVNIEVRLNMETDFVTLSIKDNGIGFDSLNVKTNKKGGLGINNINYLAYYLKGSAQIKSEIGKGTEILVIFPGVSSRTYREKIV